MRVTHTRAAAALTAIAAGAFAAYELGPAGGGVTEASRPAAAEVRTEVIRRTIHLRRPAKPRGALPAPPARARPASAAGPLRTHTSGGHGEQDGEQGGGDD